MTTPKTDATQAYLQLVTANREAQAALNTIMATALPADCDRLQARALRSINYAMTAISDATRDVASIEAALSAQEKKPQ